MLLLRVEPRLREPQRRRQRAWANARDMDRAVQRGRSRGRVGAWL